MVAALVIVAAVRLRLLNLPLERDEGEYACAGQLMLQGIPPYEFAYNMKFPGTNACFRAGKERKDRDSWRCSVRRRRASISACCA